MRLLLALVLTCSIAPALATGGPVEVTVLGYDPPNHKLYLAEYHHYMGAPPHGHLGADRLRERPGGSPAP